MGDSWTLLRKNSMMLIWSFVQKWKQLLDRKAIANNKEDKLLALNPIYLKAKFTSIFIHQETTDR